MERDRTYLLVTEKDLWQKDPTIKMKAKWFLIRASVKVNKQCSFIRHPNAVGVRPWPKYHHWDIFTQNQLENQEASLTNHWMFEKGYIPAEELLLNRSAIF